MTKKEALKTLVEYNHKSLGPGYYNVNVELNDYKPVLFDEIVERIKK